MSAHPRLAKADSCRISLNEGANNGSGTGPRDESRSHGGQDSGAPPTRWEDLARIPGATANQRVAKPTCSNSIRSVPVGHERRLPGVVRQLNELGVQLIGPPGRGNGPHTRSAGQHSTVVPRSWIVSGSRGQTRDRSRAIRACHSGPARSRPDNSPSDRPYDRRSRSSKRLARRGRRSARQASARSR
jgi:hypothetical protein